MIYLAARLPPHRALASKTERLHYVGCAGQALLNTAGEATSQHSGQLQLPLGMRLPAPTQTPTGTCRGCPYQYMGVYACIATALHPHSAGNLDPPLIPDTLHPSPEGYDKMFSECWEGVIARIFANRACRGANSTAACTTAEGRAGHCVSGACRVTRSKQAGTCRLCP